ncbi:MAG: bifunctional oligoribonuclease/PAP phosphatase NrnA [Bacteroidales bacterium]|nr:bifunctional oligoribonuclease/PAP phosphatase NrnA [Candidatus Physcousia equi]
MKNLLTDIECQTLARTIEAAHKIVLVCHINPDGDALGAMTAMQSMLQRHGHEAVCVAPDRWPDNLNWMPGVADVLQYLRHEKEVEERISDADLIVMLDHGKLDREGELGHLIATLPAPRIIIDHHPEPDTPCAVFTVCQPKFCAASEVLYRVADQLGWTNGLITEEAVSLYTGMMTDTGGFTFNSSRPELFHIIAHLLETGIDKDRLYRNVYYTATPDRYRMLGYLLYAKMELLRDYHTSIMSLTNEERRRFNIRSGETDGFVNEPLCIEGMRLSIFLREDTEKKGVIRLSLRSVDDFPCNEMAAEFFNGGGHLNASGGRLYCTMDEAIEQAKQAVRKYAGKLKQK